MLSTKDLSIGYNGKSLIDSINLSFSPGKISVLIGPNGCGKSTLLKTISGSIAPIAGEVLLEERSLHNFSNMERAKSIAVMSTKRFDAEYITVYEVIAAGRFAFTDFLGRLNSDDREIIAAAMKRTGVLDIQNSDFNKLSDGQKQRALLARALAQSPKVLILDEPTSFLDIGYKLEFVEILKSLAYDSGIELILSLHEVELVKELADEVICISDKGKIERVGSYEQVIDGEYLKRLFSIKSDRFESIYGY